MTLKNFALGFVFVWFIVGGVAHFAATPYFLKIMPPSMPYHLEAVYLSGALEILGALGLLWRRSRRLAGIGLFLLTLAVTPANVYMWQNPQLFPQIPPFALGFRLWLQVALLGCIWWASVAGSSGRPR